MKAKTPAQYPSGFVFKIIQFKVKGFGPKRVTVQRAPNNRRSKSHKYRTMDNNVNSLDSQYKILPQTGPDFYPCKDAWENASTLYSGWQLCGCQDTAINGQKFFRAWNLNRMMLGLSQIDAPIDEGVYTNVNILHIFLAFHLGILDGWGWVGAAFPNPYHFTVGIGDGMNNPLFDDTGNNVPVFDIPPTADEQRIWDAVGLQAFYKVCSFTDTGRPMLSGSVSS